MESGLLSHRVHRTGHVEKTKQIIQQCLQDAEPSVPLIVNFSGGKDSLAVVLLLKEMGVKNVAALYMRSSIDLPGAVAYAQSQAAKLGLPLIISHPENYQGTFIDQVRRWRQFPTPQNAWCSWRLKVRPARAHLRELYGKASLYKLTGVRRQESTRRMRIYKGDMPIEKDAEHAGSFLVHPILHWTDGHVLEFLDKYPGVVGSPLYKSTGVSGCYWCPFYQESILERVERTFPGILDPIADIEHEIGKPALMGQKYLKYVLERVRTQMSMELGV